MVIVTALHYRLLKLPRIYIKCRSLQRNCRAVRIFFQEGKVEKKNSKHLVCSAQVGFEKVTGLFFFFPARLRRCQTFAITAVNDCRAHDVCGRGVWISVWKVFQLCSCDFWIKRRQKKNTSFVIESKIGGGERERVENGNVDFISIMLFSLGSNLSSVRQ